MDDTGATRDDVKLPEYPDGFAREIKGLFESGKAYTVTVLSAMAHDQIIAIKEEAEEKK